PAFRYLLLQPGMLPQSRRDLDEHRIVQPSIGKSDVPRRYPVHESSEYPCPVARGQVTNRPQVGEQRILVVGLALSRELLLGLSSLRIGCLSDLPGRIERSLGA